MLGLSNVDSEEVKLADTDMRTHVFDMWTHRHADTHTATAKRIERAEDKKKESDESHTEQQLLD